MYTLYLAMTGGRSWGEFANPLADIHWYFALLFYFFMAFIMFAVLNVVTGIVVEAAIAKAQAEQEQFVKGMLDKKKEDMKKIEGLFRKIGSDGSGSVTLEELLEFLEVEQMKIYFLSLDMEVHDAVQLFHCVDLDGGGSVNIDEFVDGC